MPSAFVASDLHASTTTSDHPVVSSTASWQLTTWYAKHGSPVSIQRGSENDSEDGCLGMIPTRIV